MLLALVYLFMDELSKAVALFYPSTSGGGFNQPPAPSGDSAFFPISSTSENQEQPGPSHEKRSNIIPTVISNINTNDCYTA